VDQRHQISPDSARVVYRATQDASNVHELYSVPIRGGDATKLSGPMAPGGEVSTIPFRLSLDSQWVVYCADQDTDEVYELYRVPLDGGTSAAKVNGPLAPGVDVLQFEISPDSSSILFRVGDYEVWSAPLVGGTPIHVGQTVQRIRHLEVVPTPNRALYSTSGIDPGLFMTPLGGGTTVQLNDHPMNGAVAESIGFRTTPDLEYTVYVSTEGVFRAPLTGSASTLVDPNTAVRRPEITPDSQRLVYERPPDLFGPTRLMSVSLLGGEAAELSPDVDSWVVTRDSSRVVFVGVAPGGPPGSYRIYATPVAGGLATALDPQTGSIDFDVAPQVSGDSSRVAFLYRVGLAGPNELFDVPITGGAPRRLNASLTPGGNVTHFLMRGDLFLYRADQDANDLFELFATLLPVP
jgi:Tol biopolymer transport system component